MTVLVEHQQAEGFQTPQKAKDENLLEPPRIPDAKYSEASSRFAVMEHNESHMTSPHQSSSLTASKAKRSNFASATNLNNEEDERKKTMKWEEYQVLTHRKPGDTPKKKASGGWGAIGLSKSR